MIKKWEILKEELIDLKWRKFLRRTYLLPNGKKAEFLIKKASMAVCVFALTTEDNVVLTKQYRPGPDKILLELPGGMVDKGETPEEAARREFLEETGYDGELKYIGESLDDAYSSLARYNFVCLNCKKVQEQKLDDTEFMEVEEMSLEKFRKHLRSGQLTDVETGYLALDFLNLL